jgi:ferredoxin
VHIHTTEHDGRPDFADIASTLSSQTMVYCCGSASMLEAVESSFPAERLHVERFAPTVKTFAPNAQFEVHCMRSGQTVPVGVEESMLDALNYAGFHVPSGCREGVCGSCEVVVLDGQPEHRDDIGAAAGTMYTCVSRALSAGIAVDL